MLEEEGELAALADAVEVAVHLVVLAACGHSPPPPPRREPPRPALRAPAAGQAPLWARGSVASKAESIWGKGSIPLVASHQEGLYPPHLQERRPLGCPKPGPPLQPSTEACDNGPPPLPQTPRGPWDPGQGVLMTVHYISHLPASHLSPHLRWGAGCCLPPDLVEWLQLAGPRPCPLLPLRCFGLRTNRTGGIETVSAKGR